MGDLVEYRKSRDKGVMVAARAILQLYRDVNPGMLKKRERVSFVLFLGGVCACVDIGLGLG